MSDSSVDSETLRRDLDRIEEAMDIADRYETAPRQWLLFGGFVGAGAALCQYVVLEQLPAYWLLVAWGGFLAGGGSFAGYSTSILERSPSEKPNIPLLLLAPALAGLPLAIVVRPYLSPLAYQQLTTLTLAGAVTLLGVGYLLAANGLRAYRIRARDRRAFAVGGVVLLTLGVCIVTLDVLHTWGYAAFAATFVTYSVVSYGVLTATE
jgi:hypothetical protein